MLRKYLKFNPALGSDQEEYPIQESNGIADAGKMIASDEEGFVSESLLRNSEVHVMEASELIADNSQINIWNDEGTPKIRKASNTSIATKSHGFVKAGIAMGATGKIYSEGKITGLVGLIPGETYFTGVAGAIIPKENLPAAALSIVQAIGYAASPTVINYEMGKCTILAG